MTPPGGGERFPSAGAVPQGAALFVSEEVTAYGNKSGIDRHHRGAGIFGGGAERAAARIRRLYHRAHGPAVPGTGREHHLGGAGRAPGQDRRAVRQNRAAARRQRQNTVFQRHFTGRRKPMKRFVSLLLAVLMAAAVLSGCAKQPQTPETPQEEAVTIRVGGLKGPTSMGLVKLLDDAENQKTANAIDFQMAASANELNPLFLKGELDILAVPANLGSVLYNKTQGGVKMLAVSTLGVLYMVEKGGETVTDIKSLAGKTIYATGKGATPEYALTYLLARNGLELGKDVNVEWKSEPTEIVAQMAAQDSAVAMLPQPFVVVAMGQVEGLRVALDLTEQWNALGGDSQLITAVLLVRSEFLDQHPQAVARFMKEYAASAAFVNDQPAEAAVLVEKYGIVKAAVAEKAIPACNIVCLLGDEMKTAASGYLQVLFDQNPESVGGKLPGDDFYWMGN